MLQSLKLKREKMASLAFGTLVLLIVLMVCEAEARQQRRVHFDPRLPLNGRRRPLRPLQMMKSGRRAGNLRFHNDNIMTETNFAPPQVVQAPIRIKPKTSPSQDKSSSFLELVSGKDSKPAPGETPVPSFKELLEDKEEAVDEEVTKAPDNLKSMPVNQGSGSEPRPITPEISGAGADVAERRTFGIGGRPSGIGLLGHMANSLVKRVRPRLRPKRPLRPIKGGPFRTVYSKGPQKKLPPPPKHGLRKPPKIPSGYGPPKAPLIQSGYGVPKAPIQTSYQPQSAPTDSYGPPKAPVTDSYGPPKAPLSDSYGPPQAPVSDSYGPPKAPLSDSYGPPQAPVSDSYGPPKAPIDDTYNPPKDVSAFDSDDFDNFEPHTFQSTTPSIFDSYEFPEQDQVRPFRNVISGIERPKPAAPGKYTFPEGSPVGTAGLENPFNAPKVTSYVKQSTLGQPNAPGKDVFGFVPTAPRNNFEDTIEDEINPDLSFDYNFDDPISGSYNDRQPVEREVKNSPPPVDFKPLFAPSKSLPTPSLTPLKPKPSEEDNLPPMITLPPPTEPFDESEAVYDDEEEPTFTDAKGAFDEDGPSFSFPDFGMEELMDIIDIEKFFNENFFKKIPEGKKKAQNFGEQRESFMHGVPESGYEPTPTKEVNPAEDFIFSQTPPPPPLPSPQTSGLFKPAKRPSGNLPTRPRPRPGPKGPINGLKPLLKPLLRPQPLVPRPQAPKRPLPAQKNVLFKKPLPLSPSDPVAAPTLVQQEKEPSPLFKYATNTDEAKAFGDLPSHFLGGADDAASLNFQGNPDPWKDTKKIPENFQINRRHKRSASQFMPSPFMPHQMRGSGFQPLESKSSNHHYSRVPEPSPSFPNAWSQPDFFQDFDFGRVRAEVNPSSPFPADQRPKSPRLDDDPFVASPRARISSRRTPLRVATTSAPATTLPFLESYDYSYTDYDYFQKDEQTTQRSRVRVQNPHMTTQVTERPATVAATEPSTPLKVTASDDYDDFSTFHTPPQWNKAGPPQWAMQRPSKRQRRPVRFQEEMPSTTKPPRSRPQLMRHSPVAPIHEQVVEKETPSSPFFKDRVPLRSRTKTTTSELPSPQTTASTSGYRRRVTTQSESVPTGPSFTSLPTTTGTRQTALPRSDTDVDYEAIYYDMDEKEQNEFGEPVMSRPHPTNPDYEYVYYYDYEDGEGSSYETIESDPTFNGPPKKKQKPQRPPTLPPTLREQTPTRIPPNSLDLIQKGRMRIQENLKDDGVFSHPHRDDFHGPRQPNFEDLEPVRPQLNTNTARPKMIRHRERQQQQQPVLPFADPSPPSDVVDFNPQSERYPLRQKPRISLKDKAADAPKPQAFLPTMSTRFDHSSTPKLRPSTASVFASHTSTIPTTTTTESTTSTTTSSTTSTTTTTTTTTTTVAPTTLSTSTTTTSTTEAVAHAPTRMRSPGFPYKMPQDYPMPKENEDPCNRGLFCSVSSDSYPMKSVVSIVVSEGPAVQGTYQQVIRDFPSLIGATPMWGTRKGRTGSCETIEETLKPGWAKTMDGQWVAVVNTNEYPQEVKTILCHTVGETCSMMYSRLKSRCEQKYQHKSLMVVDPKRPEKGVFAAEFKIPTNCACSLSRGADVFIPAANEDPTSSSLDISPLRTRDPLRTNVSRIKVRPKPTRRKDEKDADGDQSPKFVPEVEKKVTSSPNRPLRRRKGPPRRPSQGLNEPVVTERSRLTSAATEAKTRKPLKTIDTDIPYWNHDPTVATEDPLEAWDTLIPTNLNFDEISKEVHQELSTVPTMIQPWDTPTSSFKPSTRSRKKWSPKTSIVRSTMATYTDESDTPFMEITKETPEKASTWNKPIVVTDASTEAEVTTDAAIKTTGKVPQVFVTGKYVTDTNIPRRTMTTKPLIKKLPVTESSELTETSSSKERVPPKNLYQYTTIPTRSPISPGLKKAIRIKEDMYASQLNTSRHGNVQTEPPVVQSSSFQPTITTTTTRRPTRPEPREGTQPDAPFKPKGEPRSASDYIKKLRENLANRRRNADVASTTITTTTEASIKQSMDDNEEIMQLAPSRLSKGTFGDTLKEFQREEDKIDEESDYDSDSGFMSEPRTWSKIPTRGSTTTTTTISTTITTTTSPAQDEEPAETMSQAETFKKFLKSGVNDPRKIKAMLERMKSKENSFEPTRAPSFIAQDLDEANENEPEAEIDKFANIQTNFESRPWSPHQGRGSSSSSFFNNFVKSNNVRPPRPQRPTPAEAQEPKSSARPSKFGNHGRRSTPRPDSEEEETSPSTARKYAPKFTTSRNNGFWPTPRPFGPKKTMTKKPTTTTRRTTTTTTTTTTTSTTTPTTTTTTVYSQPSLKLDTANFVFDGEFDSPFMDLEKIPEASNSIKDRMSVDSTSFIYDDSLGEETSAATPRRYPAAKIPIRNVLDIFQELKLSFGRKTR